MNKCWLFHDWGKWESYSYERPERRVSLNYVLAATIHDCQQRVCNRCGKIQHQEVSFRVVED